MSSEQPPSGPPSGPLSGSSGRPPSGPGGPPTVPGAPQGEPPGGAGAPAPAGRPWWRRSSLLIPALLVLGLVVALTVVLLDRPASAQAVMLQPAGSTGPDPFTPPAHTGPGPSHTARASHSAAPVPTGGTSGAGGVRTVSGTSVGLYGGTERLSSCDVAQMSAFLRSHPDKGGAWAGIEGIRDDQIDAFLHSLTPVLLRTDTRVTNHGFANGAATSFQSVLEAGTAVLVDSYGAPRARCACGNPLLAPVVTTRSTYTGTSWSSFKAQNVTVILPAVTRVDVIVLYDDTTGRWFKRPTGGTGGDDVTIPAPVIRTGGPTGSAAPTGSATCLPSGPAGSSSSGTGAPSGPVPGSEQACPSGSSASATGTGPGTPSASGSPSESASVSASVSVPPSSATPLESASTASSNGSGPGSSGPGTVTTAPGPS